MDRNSQFRGIVDSVCPWRGHNIFSLYEAFLLIANVLNFATAAIRYLSQVEDSIDAILKRVYVEANPFWDPPHKMMDDEYRTFEFPFEPVEGTEHTGPFEFEANQSMNLDEYLMYIRSWSAYQTGRQKGFELLRGEVIGDFRCAWGGEDEKHNIKVAKFPVFCELGRWGNKSCSCVFHTTNQ